MKKLSDFVRGVIPHKTKLNSRLPQPKISRSNLTHTPLSNTGYDSQVKFECGVDWLDFTFRNAGTQADTEEIIKEVEALTGDSIDFSFTKPVMHGRAWDGSGRGVIGTCVWYDGGYDAGDGSVPKPPQIKFSLTGRVMAAIDFPILADWLAFRAASNDLDCTRIDVCVDDKERLVKMERITQAYEAENFFNAKYCNRNASKSRGDNEGVTVYFGHPQSHKRLRIYDKFAESKGKVKGIRWEAQFRKAVARDVLFTILEKIDESVEEATTYYKDVVTGLIDFRDRSGGDPNRARCKTLPWFARFCRALRAEPIRMTIALKEPVVQRSIDWIEKSVSQSLSVVKKVLKDDWEPFITSIIYEGGSRLNNRKQQLIQATDRDKLIYSI